MLHHACCARQALRQPVRFQAASSPRGSSLALPRLSVSLFESRHANATMAPKFLKDMAIATTYAFSVILAAYMLGCGLRDGLKEVAHGGEKWGRDLGRNFGATAADTLHQSVP